MQTRAKRRVGRWQISQRKPLAVVGFLLQFALAGCAADGVETDIKPEAEAPPSAAAKDTPAEIAVLTPTQPEKPAPKPPPDLMGKQRAEIVKILGSPVFSRSDRPALLMRYRQDGCILDLFLYPTVGTDADGQASAQAVEHVEARSTGGGKIASEDCIAAVIKARSSDQKS